MKDQTTNERPDTPVRAIMPEEKSALLEKIDKWAMECFGDHLESCPFEVRLESACAVHPDPWSALQARADAEWEEFKRECLEEHCPLVFELPDGTKYRSEYENVEEREDGSLKFSEGKLEMLER